MTIDLDKIFTGQTVTIVGGGTSLKDFDFDRVKGLVIAVNYSCFSLDSDMLVAVDPNFQVVNKEFLESYKGYFVTDRETAVKNAKMIKYTSTVYPKHDWFCKKANLSGFIALAVAVHLEAEKIVLLGFDGGFSGEEANYYNGGKNNSEHGYSSANQYYDLFIGKNIVNVGMDSKIESFVKIPIEEYET